MPVDMLGAFNQQTASMKHRRCPVAIGHGLCCQVFERPPRLLLLDETAISQTSHAATDLCLQPAAGLHAQAGARF